MPRKRRRNSTRQRVFAVRAYDYPQGHAFAWAARVVGGPPSHVLDWGRTREEAVRNGERELPNWLATHERSARKIHAAKKWYGRKRRRNPNIYDHYNLVLRVGDQSDYSLHGSLAEVAEVLREFGATSVSKSGAPKFGVAADRYTGQNYISLYNSAAQDESQIGGPTDTPVELSSAELEELNRLLKTRRSNPRRGRLGQGKLVKGPGTHRQRYWKTVQKQTEAEIDEILDHGDDPQALESLREYLDEVKRHVRGESKILEGRGIGKRRYYSGGKYEHRKKNPRRRTRRKNPGWDGGPSEQDITDQFEHLAGSVDNAFQISNLAAKAGQRASGSKHSSYPKSAATFLRQMGEDYRMPKKAIEFYIKHFMGSRA